MNRSILLTGGGSGLGLCILRRHLELGDRVCVLERTLSGELASLQAAQSGRVTAVACDVADSSQVERAGEAVRSAFERVDVLYNVAGVYRPADRIDLVHTDMEAFAPMYEVNAVGPLRVCRMALDLLGEGSVVLNVSSEAGSIGACWREQEYAYCMSKAALNMGMRILSNALKGRGVRIFNVHPGWMRTAMGGREAMNSSRSVAPEESARALVDIALAPASIPEGEQFFEYTRAPLPW